MLEGWAAMATAAEKKAEALLQQARVVTENLERIAAQLESLFLTLYS
jgi:hypothetical protein